MDERFVKDIEQAVRVLHSGGLVAFPTETVYGLGADAENEAAVRRVFEVKGRPTGHPLIVHLKSSAALADWAAEVPAEAETLAKWFWPGPLTLVLRRSHRVPNVVTGGLDTVGLRVPAHPVALALLQAFRGAIAAPSANRFGHVSPTTAQHVREDLRSEVDFILDGGPCTVGVESTIVDLSSDDPAILRPGGVTREQLEHALGRPMPLRSGGPVRSPGQQALHYSPRAQVLLVNSDELPERARALLAQGLRVVALCPGDLASIPPNIARIALANSPVEMARSLYTTLREVDRMGFDAALVVLPPEEGLGLAIVDRLQRAAGPRAQP